MLKKCILLVGLMASFSMRPARSQNDVVLSLAAGREDAEKLMNAYLGPFGQAFSLGLAQNWNQTAKPLKFLRVNVQAGLSLVAIPGEDQYFNPENLGLSSLRPLDSRATTLAGPTNVNAGYVV
ncbi:MAG: hypothetical protein EBS53_02305, partial [Bacteroidetes bacterium]|nr:hypothetical protein [Bacteroidota bacterium]